MKIILLIIFLPLVTFSQYLANRYFLEVSGNYRKSNLKELNSLIDELHEATLVVDWFEGKLEHFKDGKGLGIGFGYGFSHYFAIGLRYDEVKYKNYNRDFVTGTVDSIDVEVESNLNFKLLSKALSLNLFYYPFNSPFLGIFLGAGGGIVFNTKFEQKLYFTLEEIESGVKGILLNSSLTYKQDKIVPIWQIFGGIDIALGVLTSLIFECGYRHATIPEIKNNGYSLKNENGEKVKIDLSHYFGSLLLRFVF